MLGRILSQEDVALFPVNLNEPFESALTLIKKVNPTKNIQVSSSRFRNATVLADGLLEEAFVNVLSNSVKYTKGNDVSIEVHVEEINEQRPADSKPKSYWKVAVTDHGRGIPDDKKPSASTRYMETERGSGLGLSIVRALVVDRYSGKLFLKN
jgi:signal transduction histidine kinase